MRIKASGKHVSGMSLRGMLLLSTFLVAGCQATTGVNSKLPLQVSDQAAGRVAGLHGADLEQNSSIKTLVNKSVAALERRHLKEASGYINQALKLDITNPDIQYLNGLTYHLMAAAGDSSKLALAEQGYRQAIKFDPSHLQARYQLGQLYMDQRRYGLAQGYFASVALHRSDDPAVLYSLAASSYYARDPETAEAALKRLMEVSPDARRNPDVLKAKALALAAMNDRIGAAKFVEAYLDVAASKQGIQNLERRVQGWREFYDTDAKVLLAQFAQDPYASQGGSQGNACDSSPNPYGVPGGADGSAQGQGVGTSGGFVDPDMVVVDVVLIGMQEDIRDSRGINLLNGLELQFGDPLTGTVGLGYTQTRTKDYLNSGLAQSTQTLTRNISIPAVKYSLNIANSTDANNQILAKPSLVAQMGQTSEFFSGTEILAAAVSGGNGDSVSVQKEVGVKLAVTPEALPDDKIRLHVVAERTFHTDPSNSVVFEFRLDTTKTNVNSTVTMKYGETLILGGLSERETSKSSDGVPGLMNIPILNYLFSQRVQRQFERSILILLTPRRPQYARRAEEDRQKTVGEMSDLEKDIDRLSHRHQDWFTPHPTFNEIFKKLQGREFFQEFRSGDVQIQSWEKAPESLKRIGEVRDRLMNSL